MEWLSDLKTSVFGDSPVLDSTINAINSLNGSKAQQLPGTEAIASQVAAQNQKESNTKWFIIGGGVLVLVAVLFLAKRR